MSDTTHRIQIRLGQNSPEKLRKWADNQTNLNESVKKLIDHFVDLYGGEDIDSLNIKLKMARDLLTIQGNETEQIKIPEKVIIQQEPEEIQEEEEMITHRGKIEI